MANTPEGKVKDKIKAVLKGYHAYYHMPVQNGMGSPTLDFTGCYYGHFFGIEAKAPGKVPTKRQELTIKSMTDAGAVVFVIDGDMHMLDAWCKTIKCKYEGDGVQNHPLEGLNHDK
jgi:hypothetical protein